MPGPFVGGRLAFLGGGGAAFTPASLSNLAAWWQFNTGITDDGGAVSQWDDQSGNDRHLKQATGTNQPAKQVDGAILFDGVDNFLKCDAFTLNQPFTVYMLMKQVTWSSADYFFDGNTVNRVTINPVSATPQIRLYDVAANDPTGTVSLPLDAYAVLTAVAAPAASLQVNNGTPATGTFDPGSSMGGFTLGGRGDGAGNFANIEVKEIVLSAAADDAATQTKVKNYLAGVGGLSI